MSRWIDAALPTKLQHGHHILDVGEFSILTAEQRVDDLSAAHRRSIRWLNVCVRSAVLLWSVYMSMGRLLGCVLCVVMERLQLLG